MLFLLVDNGLARLGILVVAAGTDLLGRRLGATTGKLAHRGVHRSGRRQVVHAGRVRRGGAVRRAVVVRDRGVLLRDLVATIAFVVTYFSGRPVAIPARLGGKAVTVAQVLTLVAFLTESPLLRPLAWATAAIALYAIWDYSQAAASAKRPVGQ